MTFTFETADFIQIGSLYGRHTFTVEADSVQEAWDKVRQVAPPVALLRIKA